MLLWSLVTAAAQRRHPGHEAIRWARSYRKARGGCPFARCRTIPAGLVNAGRSPALNWRNCRVRALESSKTVFQTAINRINACKDFGGKGRNERARCDTQAIHGAVQPAGGDLRDSRVGGTRLRRIWRPQVSGRFLQLRLSEPEGAHRRHAAARQSGPPHELRQVQSVHDQGDVGAGAESVGLRKPAHHKLG